MSRERSALIVLVLAAGKGKRLRSKTIKLLHPVAGRPMIVHLLEAAAALRPRRLVTVIGHQAEQLREAVGERRTEFVLQREQRGTGHAVLQAAPRLREPAGATLLILNGDLPAIRTATLRKLVSRHRRTGAALSLITAKLQDPSGYGRVLRGSDGAVQAIVEQRDATPQQRRIDEVNCGIYCAEARELLSVLRRLRPDNVQGEYYLTDAVRALLERKRKVVALLHEEPDEILGVNTREELAQAARILYRRKSQELQDRGVTLLDAERTWIDPRARIGRDSTIYPDVIVEGPSILGEDCVVGPGCRLVDVKLGRGARILDHCVLLQSEVGSGAQVGPFAHLRPGSILESDSRVGNFVELKKTKLGRGSKANHLTYLGDASIGAECNVGAGTITCNYDGVTKHPTTLGKRVFIGSDTQLIAPVEVGEGAYVAAGTSVTRDVPPGALAIGRCRQRNVEGWVERRRKKATAAGKSRSRKRG